MSEELIQVTPQIVKDIATPPQNEVKPPFLKRKIFNSRLSRDNYVLGFLLFNLAFFYLILAVPLFFPDYRTQAQILADDLNTTRTIISYLVVVPIPAIFIICNYSLWIRRSHDLNVDQVQVRKLGGWNNLMMLIFTPGTIGPNKYGDPQKGIGIRQILGIS